MRFDPESKYYVFSTEQFMTHEQEREFLGNELQKNLETLKAFADPNMRQTMGVASAAPVKTVMILIIAAAVVVGFIVFSKHQLYRVVIGMFGGIFLLAGLYMVFTKNEENYSAQGTGMKQRTNGLFIGLIGLVIAGGAVISNYVNTSKVMVVGAGVLFMVVGLFFVMPSLNNKIRSEGLVGEQISAECIGYVRSVAKADNIRYVVTSPVLSYYYNGVQYTAIDNQRFEKNNVPVAVGQTLNVTIDPKDPNYVTSMVSLNESKGSAFMRYAFPLIFVFVGAGLVWFGTTHDMTQYEIKNNKLPDLTDEVVEEKVGNYDWTIEKVTVSDKRYDDEVGSWLVAYGEERFFYCSKELADSCDIGEDYYLVFNNEKNIRAIYRANDWNYEISPEHEMVQKAEF